MLKRTSSLRHPLSVTAAAPVREPALCKSDGGGRRFLRLLLQPLEGEQNLALGTFFSEEDAVDDAVAVDSHLSDVAVEMAGGLKAPVADLLHGGQHRRRVAIGEFVDELLDWTSAASGCVFAPPSAPTLGRTPGRGSRAHLVDATARST